MWSILRGVLLYNFKSHTIMCPTKGVVLGPFWSKNAGINVDHFGLESGLVFEGPTGAYA